MSTNLFFSSGSKYLFPYLHFVFCIRFRKWMNAKQRKTKSEEIWCNVIHHFPSKILLLIPLLLEPQLDTFHLYSSCLVFENSCDQRGSHSSPNKEQRVQHFMSISVRVEFLKKLLVHTKQWAIYISLRCFFYSSFSYNRAISSSRKTDLSLSFKYFSFNSSTSWITAQHLSSLLFLFWYSCNQRRYHSSPNKEQRVQHFMSISVRV